MNDQTTGAEPDPTEQAEAVTEDYAGPGESEHRVTPLRSGIAMMLVLSLIHI